MKKLKYLFWAVTIAMSFLLLPGLIKANQINLDKKYNFSYNSETHQYFDISGVSPSAVSANSRAYCVELGVQSPPENSKLNYRADYLTNNQLKTVACLIKLGKDSNITDEKISIGIGNYVKYGNYNYNSNPIIATATVNECVSSETSLIDTPSACNRTGTFNITTAPSTLTLVGDYYYSNAINISYNTYDSYKINFTTTNVMVGDSEEEQINAPTGTTIVTSPSATTNLDLTKDQTATTLYLKIPKNSITENQTSVGLSFKTEKEICNVTTYSARVYGDGLKGDTTGNLQDLVVLTSSTTPKKITSSQTQSYSLSIINKNITISKKAITGENELASATIKITDTNNNKIYEFVTTTTPWEGYLAAGNYILSETVAPIGYERITNSYNFSVNDLGVITSTSTYDEFKITNSNSKYGIEIKNTPKKINILKTDITNVTPLANAKFKIECENDYKTTFTSTTTATPIDIVNLLNTTCKLIEEEAPTGYEKLNNDLSFKVSNDGLIEVVGSLDKHYKIENSNITVYNGNIPDTGLFTWISLIFGSGMIAFGTFLLLKNNKKKII